MDQSAPAPTSFCPRCGTAVAPDDRFCRSCAFDLRAAAPPAEGVPPAAPSAWGGEPPSQSWPAGSAPGGPAAAPAAGPAVAPAAPAAGGGRPGVAVAVTLVAAIAVLAAAAAIASGAIRTPLTTHTVAGTFDLRGDPSSITVTGDTCAGAGGYGDVRAGEPVTVKDEKGTILDATSLGAGKGSAYDCVFPFTVTVPDSAQFYTFTIGRRGDVTNSHADMVASGWTMGLTLGGN